MNKYNQLKCMYVAAPTGVSLHDAIYWFEFMFLWCKILSVLFCTTCIFIHNKWVDLYISMLRTHFVFFKTTLYANAQNFILTNLEAYCIHVKPLTNSVFLIGNIVYIVRKMFPIKGYQANFFPCISLCLIKEGRYCFVKLVYVACIQQCT